MKTQKKLFGLMVVVFISCASVDYFCIGKKCWVPGDVNCSAAQVWFEVVGDDSEDRTVVMCDDLDLSSPQIFTQGNHTHIIADDYRCSKETNGPILCWEDGGDTNCWDAWKWYQFNGDDKLLLIKI